MNLIGFRGLGYGQYNTTTPAFSLTTVPTTGNALPTGTQQAGAALALLQAEGANIRWRDDGTVPTATIGTILYVGADPYPYSGDLNRIQFIQVAAGAILNVTYYGAI